MNYRDFWEAGYKVFGLYGVTADGKCECGHPKCTALYKHPRVSNWQHTPVWSEEQLETMEMLGHFKTGYGIVLDETLVLDVDARNGGVQSWLKLTEALPVVASSDLIVNTGSGNGSKHHFFKIPPGVALLKHMADYKGIDFKSGASFVVGPGSRHASGNLYEIALGAPDDVSMAPPELLELLRMPERHRADIGGRAVDVSLGDLEEMLRYVQNDNVDYDQWVKIGMALHHASNGEAYHLWDAWSQTSSKYDESEMPKKWLSFGKAANPVTLGTLTYYAEKAGWVAPVTFNTDQEFVYEQLEDDPLDINTDDIDLNRPPGFTGQLAAWIESTVRRKRERLSAMAAIHAIGNIAGLRYTDDMSGVSSNLMVFNVAGSGTGKEAIQTAIADIHRACGFEVATYGSIKSEQEIIRNLVRHQPAFYLADEVGSLLTKIKNAQKRGGAAYLDGIIAMLMSSYSKANGWLQLTGDMKEEVKSDLLKKLSQVEKKIDEDGERPHLTAMKKSYEAQIIGIDSGLKRPFLSVGGFTTNRDFDEMIDYTGTVNGFIGRSLICIEHDTAPPLKKGFVYNPLSERMTMALQTIAMGGSYDVVMTPVRLDYYGPKIVVPSDPAALELLERIMGFFDRAAYEHTTDTGLEALYMRGFEQVAKVSLILSIPGGLRTEEHVRWAYALVKRDIISKIHLVVSNDRIKDNPEAALRSKIASLTSGDDGETLGVILNKARAFKQKDIERCLEKMVAAKLLSVEETTHKYNKKVVKRYKSIDRK